MKILAFTDIHESKSKIDQILKKSKDVDLLICCGDFTYFENDLKGVIKALAKANKPTIILHGNHEYAPNVKAICEKYDNMIFLNDSLYTFGNLQFFAHGGGGFSYTDKKLEVIAKKIEPKLDKSKKLIFITHAPPYGTKLDLLPFPGHVGCQSIVKVIIDLKPVIHLSGHLHENEGKKDKIGNTHDQIVLLY